MRDDLREVHREFKHLYNAVDVVILNAWFHQFPITLDVINGYLDKITAIRPAQLATILAEPSPSHFPGLSSHNFYNVYPSAISSIEGAACDQWRPPLQANLMPSTAAMLGAAGPSSLLQGQIMIGINAAIEDHNKAHDALSFSALSMPSMYFRGDAHVGRFTTQGANSTTLRDCGHWCLVPGVVDEIGGSLLAGIIAVK